MTTNSFVKILQQKKIKLILISILAIFFVTALLIAINLKPNIIPDEAGHIIFSKHFSTTLGIPIDTLETAEWGWYIKQNHFLYYWINGRLINLFRLFYPHNNDNQILIFLRIVNIVYASGTVIFCYLISKELIKKKIMQLLPSFLLTNTLMFVFLSAGVNYDNLANFLTTGGIYFLIQAFKKKNFYDNSFIAFCLILMGTLTKFTILPIALAAGIFWLIFFMKNNDGLLPMNHWGIRTCLLGIFTTLFIIINFSIYGINFINFQSIQPKCLDILDEELCEQNRFTSREQEYALEERLSIVQSIKLGYPNPIEYISNTWIRVNLLSIYGILGHDSYFPIKLINFYQFLFYLILFVAIAFWLHTSYLDISLVGIIILYTLALLIKNYQSELIYGFKHIAIQGRYIFPVIAPIYIIFTKILKSTPSKALRWAILIFIIGLFIYGGPLTLILKYDTVFSSWFF